MRGKPLAGRVPDPYSMRCIAGCMPRWRALTRYRDDGRVEIDNNAAERALRAVALGRKNYLFAGADAGGERAAAIYSLVGWRAAPSSTDSIRKPICVTC